MNTSLMFATIVAPGTLIGILLGVVMFGMGLATRLDDFKVPGDERFLFGHGHESSAEQIFRGI